MYQYIHIHIYIVFIGYFVSKWVKNSQVGWISHWVPRLCQAKVWIRVDNHYSWRFSTVDSHQYALYHLAIMLPSLVPAVVTICCYCYGECLSLLLLWWTSAASTAMVNVCRYYCFDEHLLLLLLWWPSAAASVVTVCCYGDSATAMVNVCCYGDCLSLLLWWLSAAMVTVCRYGDCLLLLLLWWLSAVATAMVILCCCYCYGDCLLLLWWLSAASVVTVCCCSDCLQRKSENLLHLFYSWHDLHILEDILSHTIAQETLPWNSLNIVHVITQKSWNEICVLSEDM